MRPLPFRPVAWGDDERLVRDETTGLVWHRARHRVLYADTDRSGIVYHANYLRYFELGRASIMRDLAFPYAQVEANGFVYPVVDLAMRFVKPLRYDDPMWVHTRPDRLQRVRVRFEYVITHAETDDLICTGHTLHCALNERGTVVGVDPITEAMWRDFPRGEPTP